MENPQPFIKWAGGKRKIISKITKLLPKTFNAYHEPFIGGGALFFHLSNKIKMAFLSDSNENLILTYQVIKQTPHELINNLERHKNNHSNEYFYSIRKKTIKKPVEIAAQFIYMNKTCYNGLYRVNKKGEFNVPIGKYENPTIFEKKNILECSRVLQSTFIASGDFESIKPQKGDFVYCDPPYNPVKKTSFTGYTDIGFTTDDQIRLSKFIKKLSKQGVYIMLSNSNTKLIKDLYPIGTFKHHTITAPRFVNSKPQNRGKVKELLITNY